MSKSVLLAMTTELTHLQARRVTLEASILSQSRELRGVDSRITALAGCISMFDAPVGSGAATLADRLAVVLRLRPMTPKEATEYVNADPDQPLVSRGVVNTTLHRNKRFEKTSGSLYRLVQVPDAPQPTKDTATPGRTDARPTPAPIPLPPP